MPETPKIGKAGDCQAWRGEIRFAPMNSIDDTLEAYIELETEVGRLMSHLFSDICGLCTACCCRADICEEALQSAFLSRMLEKQGLGKEQLDDRFGWLDTGGCSLEYGRPPICYAYYCDQLLERLANDEVRHATTLLGHLMDHVGQDALGDWHLVEIQNDADLERVDFGSVQQRIEEAKAAFEVIVEYLQSERLDPSGRETLSAIRVREM